MFARVKKSGKYQYFRVVENRNEKGKVKQRVIAAIGRMDRLQENHLVPRRAKWMSILAKIIFCYLSHFAGRAV